MRVAARGPGRVANLGMGLGIISHEGRYSQMTEMLMRMCSKRLQPELRKPPVIQKHTNRHSVRISTIHKSHPLRLELICSSRL